MQLCGKKQVNKRIGKLLMHFMWLHKALTCIREQGSESHQDRDIVGHQCSVCCYPTVRRPALTLKGPDLEREEQ